jgi:hypothetical protein
MHINILIWVYTVVFAINLALSVCARMYSIPACIGMNTRIMIRAYIVLYLFVMQCVFVWYAYSYDIRAFIWYAYSYDTRVRRWYTCSDRYSIDIDMRMICVSYRYSMLQYTRAILYFLRSFLFLLEKWVQWGQL